MKGRFKGIVLAGGLGTRLYPTTKAVSKQLLPIYDKPSVLYSVNTLMSGGIRDITIITQSFNIDAYKRLLGDGTQYGCSFSYAAQDEPRGIADALLILKSSIEKKKVCLILGDNIFFGKNFSTVFSKALSREEPCIFLKEVCDPTRYGVLFHKNEALGIESDCIVEKPSKSQIAGLTANAVTGLYIFDENVYSYATSLTPSPRGELEITDLNNMYLQKQLMNIEYLDQYDFWFDTGTNDSLLEASNFMQAACKRLGYSVVELNKLSLSKGWIDQSQFLENLKNES